MSQWALFILLKLGFALHRNAHSEHQMPWDPCILCGSNRNTSESIGSGWPPPPLLSLSSELRPRPHSKQGELGFETCFCLFLSHFDVSLHSLWCVPTTELFPLEVFGVRFCSGTLHLRGLIRRSSDSLTLKSPLPLLSVGFVPIPMEDSGAKLACFLCLLQVANGFKPNYRLLTWI